MTGGKAVRSGHLLDGQPAADVLSHVKDGLMDHVLCILPPIVAVFFREKEGGDKMIKAEIRIVQVLLAVAHLQVLIHHIPYLQSFFIEGDGMGSIVESYSIAPVEGIHIFSAEMAPVDSPGVILIRAVAH